MAPFFKAPAKQAVERASESAPRCPNIPPELILETSQYLSGKDLRNLAYASKQLFLLIKPVDDEDEPWTTTCESFNECETRLDEILEKPHLGIYVQRLILKPTRYVSKDDSEQNAKREEELGRKLLRVIPHLPLLRTFFWEGFETLDEEVWAALRKCCPVIQYVGTSFGEEGMCPDSHLFSFSNLYGFRVTTTIMDFDGIDRDVIVDLPEMWDMLIERCPRLLQLQIKSPFSSLLHFDIGRLMQGRWPELRELSLYNACIEEETDHAVAKDFIMYHQSLERLQLPKWLDFPINLDLSSHLAFKSFRGSMEHLLEIKFPDALDELLCDEPFLPSATNIRDLCALLLTTNFSALRRLSIKIDMATFKYDCYPITHHISIMRKILRDCVQLEHVTFICTTSLFYSGSCNFSMADLPRALIDKPKLKSIEVLKVDNGKEKCMLSTALDVLHQCPTLETIKLRYARDYWNRQSPFEDSNIRKEGTFSVTRNSETGHQSLQATELSVRSNGDRIIRKYNYPLALQVPTSGSRNSLLGLGKSKVRGAMYGTAALVKRYRGYKQEVKIRSA